MAERATLHAQPRTVLGKKVKQLRNNGILPANIYGRGLESTAVQLDEREFFRAIKSSGARSMFELAVEGEKEPRFVVLRRLDRSGGTGDLIHADFYQVDLNRPLQTNISIIFDGESPAVRDLAGTLLQMIDTVSVRCLPLDIPAAIHVDLEQLTDFDVSVTVGDLDVPQGVEILNDPSIPVVTVNPPRLRLRAGELEEGEEGEIEGEGEEEAAGEAEEAEE
jgi:large subunit ribosomal protein L25